MIRLPAGESIPAHVGAEVDTLIHVVRGDGVLLTEGGEEPLRTGDIALLPRRTVRGFQAGGEGLEYLTVHRRRKALQIGGRAVRNRWLSGVCSERGGGSFGSRSTWGIPG